MTKELFAYYEYFCVAVVQNVLHLGRSKAPVHGNRDSIQFGAAEKESEVLGCILVEVGHSVLWTDSHLLKGVCNLASLAIQRIIGPGASIACVTDSRFIALI
jgi:hypothetical protein